MLRGLVLASFGLLLLAGPAAARGGGPAAGGGKADAKASGGAGAEQRPPQPAFLLRRVAATAVVRPVAMTSPAAAGPAACGRASRRVASRCRGQAAVNWGGWAQGLPPALGVQSQECPSGTMATLAEGHDDIVRCIPI